MFSRSASYIKPTPEWRAMSSRRSADAAARRYARENMVAGILLANDDVALYCYDVANDRVSRKVYRNPEWVA